MLLCRREIGWFEACALLFDLAFGFAFVFGLGRVLALGFAFVFFALVAIVVPPFTALPHVPREAAFWQADEMLPQARARHGSPLGIRS